MMAFFAFLAYLILVIVHGCEIFEPAHVQMEHNEVKTDMSANNNINNNFNLNVKTSDMERTINNEDVLEQAQQSPELTAENPSQNH